MKPTPERIAEIRAAEAAATDGPWRECGHDRKGGCQCGLVWSILADEVVAAARTGDEWGMDLVPGRREDAAFIAIARTAIPELLAHIEELEGELAEEKRHRTHDIEGLAQSCKNRLEATTRAQKAETDLAKREAVIARALKPVASYAEMIEEECTPEEYMLRQVARALLADGKDGE